MRALGTIFLLVCFVVTSHAATITGNVIGLRENRDVVVYIDKIKDTTFKPPTEPLIILDQVNLAFKPHVLAILAGTRVRFANSDELPHNVFSPDRVDGKKLNLDTVKDWVFNTPGVVTLLCKVHIEMSAFIFVAPTPYFAVTDAKGDFEIPNVPAGSYLLKVWHERRKSDPKTIEVLPGNGRIPPLTFQLK